MNTPKLIHPDAKMPTRGTRWSAGLDLYCVDDFEIPPQDLRIIDLGFTWRLPNSMFGMIKDRSSLASRGIVVAGGIIDSDYKGEWKVILRNTMVDSSFRCSRGDRIAQLLILPYSSIMPTDTSYNDRQGGFGSTGT